LFQYVFLCATSIDGNQSPPITPVFDDGQSNVDPTSNDLPIQDPQVYILITKLIGDLSYL